MIYENDNILLFKIHKIKLFYIYWKYSLLIGLLLSIFYAVTINSNNAFTFESIFSLWSIPVFIIILINFAIITLIIDIIAYYNSVIIISNENIMIIKNVLLIKEDIEIIDISQLSKVDVKRHWVISNILWYWKIVFEQDKIENESLSFVPDPYRISNYIRKRMWNRQNDGLRNLEI
jgi:hypothetical protein